MQNILGQYNSEHKKVAFNAFFYFIYQVILFVVPLVIMPYLTRVFSESSLGEYTFSYSIAYYFVIGANLGISMYGQREISSCKNDTELLKHKFWSLFYVHSFFSILSFIAFVLFFIFSKQVNIYVFIIPYVISALFDVTWFFYGLENFKLVTIINALLALLKMACIFVFVKNDNSLWIYQLISFGSIFLSQIIIFIFAIKTVGHPIKTTSKENFAHLKPILYFALATLAITLYTYVDKTLLGLMVNDSKTSVAYYECADKIVAVPRMLITIIGIVLYPKMCALTSDNKTQNIREYTIFSIDWTSFLSFGCIFGLLALSLPLAVMYYGLNYFVTGYVMMMMSPLIFIISLGSICRSQYILPQKKDNIFLISISINAVINLILNVLLIPTLGIYGVVLSSIVAESTGLVFQLIYCRKMIPMKYLLKSVIVHLISSFVMFVVLKGILNLINPYGWSRLLPLVLIGFVVYVLILFAVSFATNYDGFVIKFIKRRKSSPERNTNL